MNYITWSSQHTNDAMSCTLTDANGAARNLTGALWCYAEMQPQLGGAYSQIAGTCALTNAAAGLVTVTWAAADVATASLYLFRILVNFGSVIKPYEATLTLTP